MPKLACRCGHIFRIDFETQEYEQCLVPLKFVEDAVLDKAEINGEQFFDDFAAHCRDVYPCPVCGRVLIEAKERPGMFDVYIKEDGRGS